MKKVISILTDILITIVFAFAAIFTASSIKRGYSNFCGYTVVQVLSNSMVDSGIERGDVKLIHEADDYHVGDIIAFYYESGDKDMILYHEIIEEQEDGGFITKGSSNALPEANVTYSDKIIGKQVNNGNYQILICVPFKVSMVLVSYSIMMGYIAWYIVDIFKEIYKPSVNQTHKEISNSPGKKKSSKNLLLWLLTFIVTTCGFTGYSVYAAGQDNLVAINWISYVVQQSTWTNSDKLTDDAYQSATDFEYAINNPTSEQGQAWSAAWSSKNTLGNSYVGSMDRNASDELDIVFDYEDANYIIKRKSQNEYYLYLTYEKLDRATGTVQPVYKTKYTRDENGNLVPVQSWVGRCNRNIYSVYQLTTYSFDTESFTEI